MLNDGFRRNRRTIDAIFIAQTVAFLAIRKKHPIFTVFVDLAKAFDSVNHQLLRRKLAAMGLSTKILRIIQDVC